MLIEYTFGPKAGTQEHVNPKDARPLILAGLAEAVNPADLTAGEGVVRAGNETYRLPKPGECRAPAPDWSLDYTQVASVEKHPAQKILCIRMDILGQTYKWFGDPKNANVQVKWNGGLRYLNGFGRPVPEEILNEYTKRWKADESLRAPKDLLYPPKAEAVRPDVPLTVVDLQTDPSLVGRR